MHFSQDKSQNVALDLPKGALTSKKVKKDRFRSFRALSFTLFF